MMHHGRFGISMKISVIMLTYNREKLVSRAIESIVKQTFTEFEFIIVDNGSDDKSGSIADSYAEKYDFIKVIHLSKSSIGKGRNAGLEIAKGDYITFIDDDDMAEPDMLEFLYNLVLSNNADISICGSSKNVDGYILPNCVCDKKLLMTAGEAVIELLKRKKYKTGMPTKLIRKPLFEKIKFKENSVYDDITVTYKYIANANNVAYHGLPKYCIERHHNNNSSFTTNDELLSPEQLEEYFEAFKERTQYLSNLLPDIAEYAQYSEWSYMISMCNKIIKNKLDNCIEQLKYIKRILFENYNEFYNSDYIEEFEKDWMERYIFENKSF